MFEVITTIFIVALLTGGFLILRATVGVRINHNLFLIAMAENQAEKGKAEWYLNSNLGSQFFYPRNFHLWTTKQWHRKLLNDYEKTIKN